MGPRHPHDFQPFTVPAGTNYYPGGSLFPVKLSIPMSTFKCARCGRFTGNPRTDDTTCRGIKGRALIRKAAHL